MLSLSFSLDLNLRYFFSLKLDLSNFLSLNRLDNLGLFVFDRRLLSLGGFFNLSRLFSNDRCGFFRLLLFNFGFGLLLFG